MLCEGAESFPELNGDPGGPALGPHAFSRRNRCERLPIAEYGSQDERATTPAGRARIQVSLDDALSSVDDLGDHRFVVAPAGRKLESRAPAAHRCGFEDSLINSPDRKFMIADAPAPQLAEEHVPRDVECDPLAFELFALDRVWVWKGSYRDFDLAAHPPRRCRKFGARVRRLVHAIENSKLPCCRHHAALAKISAQVSLGSRRLRITTTSRWRIALRSIVQRREG
jgi:hypothetical protein